MEVKGKRVLVVGLGKSGVASALFLESRGARVTVSDAKSEDQLRNEIPALLDRGITVETGKHGERTFRDQDLIVVSPGVPGDVGRAAACAPPRHSDHRRNRADRALPRKERSSPSPAPTARRPPPR